MIEQFDWVAVLGKWQMPAGIGKGLRKKWATAAKPAVGAKFAADAEEANLQPGAAGHGKELLMINLGAVIGLGFGATFAMLLVNGDISLSLKEIRQAVSVLESLISY